MATHPKIEPGGSKKDRWEKADVILRPLGALITALTIAYIGWAAQNFLTKNQEKEAKARLFTELMTRREDSESALRKDMFNSILNNILNDKANSTLDEMILEIELLTYNFHESLNLMPLFEYLNRYNNERTSDPNLKKAYRARLIKMSKAIISKQLSSLEAGSQPVPFTYEDTLLNYKTRPEYARNSEYRERIDDLYEQNSDALNGSEKTCTFLNPVFNGTTFDTLLHIIRIKILDYDTGDASARVQLTIQTSNPVSSAPPLPPRKTEFTVNYFEFPMIDNTRLDNDKRLAVVLNDFTSKKYDRKSGQPAGKRTRIELKVIYFPGSRASLKERPYFDEIVSKLLQNK